MRRFSIPVVGRTFGNQDLALAGMVGLPDDAFLFHALHDGRRAIVADLEPALDVGSRGLAVALYDCNGLLKEVAAFGETHAGRVEHRISILVLLAACRYFFEVFRRALRLQMAYHFFHFVIRYERSVHAIDSAAAGHVEHVALTEQLFGALFSQDGAAVDLGRHLERDAGREIGLDRACDHVD